MVRLAASPIGESQQKLLRFVGKAITLFSPVQGVDEGGKGLEVGKEGLSAPGGGGHGAE